MHDKRLKDILPQPVISLPSVPPPPATSSSSSRAPPSPSGSASQDINLDAEALLDEYTDTPRNVFGIFRRFYGSNLPIHDPERSVTLLTLSDIPRASPAQSTSSSATPSSSSVSSLSQLLVPSSVFYPYPNKSSFALGEWYWNGGAQKSQNEFKKLLDILSEDTFSLEDVGKANWLQINRQLAVNEWDEGEWVDEDAGWRRQSVIIQVPFHRYTENPGTRDYLAANFYHRSILSIIKDKLRNPHERFHYEPFDLLWQPSDDVEPIQLHGECYTSSSFKTAHMELQRSPREPGCLLPRVVVALMFWSDATHLTNFGNAKLWPLYMAYGNESKYERCRPSCNLLEHVAYFERLPDEFKDFATKYIGKGKKMDRDFIAHCQRELTHEQWRLLLDDAFIHAYQHGLVVECPDGLMRRFYPRIFTYSADYPEKTLMASIRQNGLCPCPRCKIPMAQAHLVGTKKDRKARLNSMRIDDLKRQSAISRSRDAVASKNYAVNSAYVEHQLKAESLVPTLNAFSDRLSKFGFNLFRMFAVDLMHEIEVGGWKNTLIHLFRILEAVDPNLLHELDKRFRQIPTFGRDTIRRFSSNVSELKQMAARNYEDFLQCAIPVFEGLLPEPHNSKILRLLFHFAHWHGLAKLRMHSDKTLAIQDNETTILGNNFRVFQAEVCPSFQTRELAREAAARNRRSQGQGSLTERGKKGKGKYSVKAKDGADGRGKPAENETNGDGAAGSGKFKENDANGDDANGSGKPKEKQQNGSEGNAKGKGKGKGTNKGEKENKNDEDKEAEAANLSGSTAAGPAPTSSASKGSSGRKPRSFTALSSYKGELEHRTPKGRYKRTSRKAVQKQLAQIERRQARIRRIREKVCSQASSTSASASAPEDGSITPTEHHHIGVTENFPQHIGALLRMHAQDPAIEGFFQKLKFHLLPRLQEILCAHARAHAHSLAAGAEDNGMELDPTRMYFKNDTMYRHNVMRIHYTTYDVRRAQDTINPNTDHRDVMFLADSTSHHQYRYARILGIYHVNVIYGGLVCGTVNYKVHRMEVLWVRWFEVVNDVAVGKGWTTGKLDRLRFVRISHEGAFGFADPNQVLRACHILPCFAEGQRHIDGKGLSHLAQDGKDWNVYYANRFVDRDMLMRFHWGLGVGHMYTRGQRATTASAVTRQPVSSDDLEMDNLDDDLEVNEINNSVIQDLQASVNNDDHGVVDEGAPVNGEGEEGDGGDDDEGDNEQEGSLEDDLDWDDDDGDDIQDLEFNAMYGETEDQFSYD
ncbi:hypothetical protein Hypma_014062 [Hypsizygus marmoreus]|uniref:Uncharacterized protein n=1 Tax=Hypsizygus marmoreus TaxID=39966 RepID=A0A369K896_HYPMA|nr:hypothetical protein Hypma_014062 [Hypsizygus marmoreus]